MIRKSPFTAAASRGALKRVLGAAAIGSVLLAAPAHADVIDFDIGYVGPVTHLDGFRFGRMDLYFRSNAAGAVAGEDLVGAFIDGADSTTCIGGSCPVNNSSVYYGGLDDSYIDAFNNVGAGFQIKSFDASFIGGTAPGTTYPAIAALLRVQGITAAGASIVKDFQLPGPTNDAFNFAHFDTGAFGNNIFVEAFLFGLACNTAGSCSGFSSDRSQFGIDNLNVSVIPEPSSALMVALGMAGVAAFTRRRKYSARQSA